MSEIKQLTFMKKNLLFDTFNSLYTSGADNTIHLIVFTVLCTTLNLLCVKYNHTIETGWL